MTYRRLAVNFRCGRCLVDARSGFRSSCGQPPGAFRERPREQKRRARVGHHHGSQTCNGYRGHRSDCLPGLGPGGTPAFDLNDCDDFLGMRARRRSVAAVASHTCLPPSVRVIVTTLAEFRVQTATRVNKGVSAVSERMCGSDIFMCCYLYLVWQVWWLFCKPDPPGGMNMVVFWHNPLCTPECDIYLLTVHDYTTATTSGS